MNSQSTERDSCLRQGFFTTICVCPLSGIQIGRSHFRSSWAIRTEVCNSVRWSVAGGGCWRACLFDQVAFGSPKLVPHARAGDETLRFDYAASQADSHPSEPVGTPLHFLKRDFCCPPPRNPLLFEPLPQWSLGPFRTDIAGGTARIQSRGPEHGGD